MYYYSYATVKNVNNEFMKQSNSQKWYICFCSVLPNFYNFKMHKSVQVDEKMQEML